MLAPTAAPAHHAAPTTPDDRAARTGVQSTPARLSHQPRAHPHGAAPAAPHPHARERDQEMRTSNSGAIWCMPDRSPTDKATCMAQAGIPRAYRTAPRLSFPSSAHAKEPWDAESNLPSFVGAHSRAPLLPYRPARPPAPRLAGCSPSRRNRKGVRGLGTPNPGTNWHTLACWFAKHRHMLAPLRLLLRETWCKLAHPRLLDHSPSVPNSPAIPPLSHGKGNGDEVLRPLP
jgi:hypothetical protein